MKRLTRRQRWVAAGLLAVVACVLTLLISLHLGGRTVYPQSTPGWAARWDATAAESGRVPGEGWDVWLEVSAELEVAVGDGTAMDLPRAAAALDRLRDVPRFTRPYEAGTPGIGQVRYEPIIEHTSVLRGAVRHAAMDGFNTALASGDTEAARAWLRRSADVSRVCRGLGGIIGVLVKQAVDGITIELRTKALLDGTLPPDASTDADLLARLDPGNTDWVLASERELGLRQIQDFRAETPFIRSLFVAAGEAGEYEAFMNHWIGAMRSNDPDALARQAAWELRIAGDRWINLTRPNLAYTVPSIAYYSGSSDLDANLNARRAGLRVMLALESHRAEHGRHPDRLEDLVPLFLEALPVDRFAPDGMLRYRVSALPGPAVRGGYLLYSLGADGEDDRGRAVQPGSFGHNGDLVFNTPPVPTGQSPASAGGPP